MQVIKPPHDFTQARGYKIFLAGSIEMGTASDWQKEFEDYLKNTDICILNPRRDNWDSSWKQEITNPQFVEQVEWELNGQEEADLIVMYFDPMTKAPVTMLELGLFKKKKPIVCCPKGFWRKGNVDVVCRRYGIKSVETLQELKEQVLRIWEDKFL